MSSRGKRGMKKQFAGFLRKNSGLAVIAAGTLVVLIVVIVVVFVMSKKDGDTDIAATVQPNKQAATTVQPTQTVPADTVKPVLVGVEDREYTLGDTIYYMTDISAQDDIDGEVDVEVDKSAVVEDTPGEYTVIYTATDKSGNKAEMTATITIKEPETEAPKKQSQTKGTSGSSSNTAAQPAASMTLEELASSVLSQITNSSMSMGQKLRAIYDYAHNRIGYYGNPCYSATDWESEAYHALKSIEKSGSVGGDCFTYCAVDKALLNALGVDSIWMENEGSSSGDHVWLLVNAGTGWYHFDSTRMIDKFICFMLTDEQVSVKSNYKRDTSKYPASAVEPYSY